MTHFTSDLSSVLAILLAAGLASSIRLRAAGRSAERGRQLNEAADFLELHARTLEQFLDSPNAPQALKTLLLQCSEILDEREAAAKFTEWTAAHKFDEPIETEETRVIGAELANLRKHDPELADKFDAALISAVAGASLRWPESAKLFEYTFPRLMTTYRGSVSV